MKKISIFSLVFACLVAKSTSAQCIKDIQSLVDMPSPCFFVGNIDYDNIDCFDPLTFQNWSYTWKIKDASTGELIATYPGIAFQHSFAKFGGYEFCLEIDKDSDPSNGIDIVECLTYTTCEVCSEDAIDIDYIKCPYGPGCEINLSAKIHAQNDIGLKPVAKFVITYLPTPQELLGGYSSYDIEFDEFDLEFDPFTDSIHINQNLIIPFQRGCFIARIVIKLLDGYGAHGTDGNACTELVLRSDEKFRCIACANKNGECIASELATQISNETGTCNIFTMCNLLRESEETQHEQGEDKSLHIMPNPATDMFQVVLPQSSADLRSIQLFDNIGRIVINYEVSVGELSSELDVQQLPTGNYFLTLREDGSVTRSAHIMISR